MIYEYDYCCHCGEEILGPHDAVEYSSCPFTTKTTPEGSYAIMCSSCDNSLTLENKEK